MKKLLAGLLCLLSVGAASAATFAELDHYSQITKKDYGLTMFNIGAESCFQKRLCVTGKIGTPIGSNDMGRYDRYWDNGDLIGNIGIRLYFTK